MKKLLILPFLAVLAMSAINQNTYNVDVTSSNIIWKGYKVTGEHTGTVKVKNGNLLFTNNQLSGGSFDVDMNSITRNWDMFFTVPLDLRLATPLTSW